MPILGIDLGSSVSVLATVGRGGVAVVRNDVSERLTPSLVTYTSKERLVGDVAMASYKSNFKTACQHFKGLMGASGHCPADAKRISTEATFIHPPLVAVEEMSGLVGYDVNRGQAVTATEVLGCYLQKLKQTGERFIGAAVTDCVVACPSWYSDVHRQAVIDACSIAGMGCLRVMNDSAATALDYGIFRASSFVEGTPQIACFIDMGYSSTSIFIAEFQPNKLEILAAVEDGDLGGRNFDRVLALYLAEEFRKSNKRAEDVTKQPKLMMKLDDEAAKVKKILSANKEAQVHIECFSEDADLNVVIGREKFESLCAPMEAQLQTLIRKVIDESPVPPSRWSCVEICGGCTRIPWVQAAIEKGFGVPISRTVNSDESVARGAAIQAAMLDPRHRVKEFAVVDKRLSPVFMRCDLLNQQRLQVSQTSENLVDDPATTVYLDPVFFHSETKVAAYPLFPARTPYFYCQWVTLPAIDGAMFKGDQATLTFSLMEADRQIGEYGVIVPKAVVAQHPGGRVKVQFFLDVHGMAQIASCLYVSQTVTLEAVKAAGADESEAAAAAPPPTVEADQCREVVKYNKTKLSHTLKRPFGWLSGSQVDSLKNRDQQFAREDIRTEQEKAIKNSLLSLCFSLSQTFGSPGTEKAKFASPQEAQHLLQEAAKYEEWVEYDEDVTFEACEAAYKELKAKSDDIDQRESETKARPRAVKSFNAVVSKALTSLGGSDVAPWVTDFRRNAVETCISESQKFMQNGLKEQDALPLYSNPVILSKDIEAKATNIKRLADEAVADAKARKAAEEREVKQANEKKEKEAAAAAAKSSAETTMTDDAVQGDTPNLSS